jgi:hypothetical protein
MTPEQINKAVAEKILNECFHDWQEVDMTFEIDYVCKKCGLETYVCQDYSVNISAAWQVVEKMREKGFNYCVSYAENAETMRRHKVQFYPCNPPLKVTHAGFAETAPMAICIAALKAVS